MLNRNGRRAAAKAVRRMPVRVQRVELTGEYEGWWADIRTNPPVGLWMDARERITADGGDAVSSATAAVDGLIGVVAAVLKNWNFVDEAGAVLPPDAAGVRRLPLDLIGELFNLTKAGVEQAPLGTSAP